MPSDEERSGRNEKEGDCISGETVWQRKEVGVRGKLYSGSSEHVFSTQGKHFNDAIFLYAAREHNSPSLDCMKMCRINIVSQTWV